MDQKPPTMGSFGAASVTGPKKNPAAEPKKASGIVRSVTIRKADNGFVIDVDREQKGGSFTPSEPKVATDLAGVTSALEEAFGGGASAAPAPGGAPAMPGDAPKPPMMEDSVTVTEAEPRPY